MDDFTLPADVAVKLAAATVPPRVGIAMPSPDHWPAVFGMSYGDLRAYTALHGIEAVGLNESGYDVGFQRDEMVWKAQQAGCGWVLHLDTDMVFPADALVRLMAHRATCNIVGAAYRRRYPPFDLMGAPAKPCPEGERGLIEMLRMPGGMLLVAMEVFTILPRPWFRFTPIHREDGTLSRDLSGRAEMHTDDVNFCDAARGASLSIWCDMALTREVAHLNRQALVWTDDGLPAVLPQAAEAVAE